MMILIIVQLDITLEFHFILFYFILFYFILFYFILFYFVYISACNLVFAFMRVASSISCAKIIPKCRN